MTGTFLLGIIGSIAEPQLDMVTTVSAVASALGNVGPGLGLVGPSETYAIVPDLGKWLLAGLMIVGRLEILPILILFNHELWKR
jgi:trk system potassium uptake protein TrkH